VGDKKKQKAGQLCQVIPEWWASKKQKIDELAKIPLPVLAMNELM